ncbi:TPA: phosphatidate cytidylyltransferase [Clostridium botulinum]|uniref:Phosphatidate cytidylyltransferase n=1 Tax=Clostridium botulinum B str. Osaka05 TaxID=1407017 RepID=A0A0S6U3A4_CLOBO|nr:MULTISPECIES: phosphatidate cytidylyltransferase [Clostridium]AUM96209.1 phosphatidate cytidylyltransferase [Clostridium sporogenes]AVQ53663.1 phosphatidate cytidylyltransferase [Clostridium botulinum]EKO1912301.1 phosphatidate cytidylyltransferase [Clostridium botulinum]EKO2042362.1 phosphatidate cytidylyltransferase [Clostridium botulinum]MBO0528516.1 phosphatidate cytidylyltransferase [Clostridium botulinum]
MNSRYIGALVLAPFVIFLFIGGVFLKWGILALSLGGMYEFYKVIKNKGIHPIEIVGYLLCLIYYIPLLNNINYKNIFYITTLAVFILLAIPVINLKYNFIDVAITLLGFLYVPVFFSFIVLVNNKAHGNYLVWLIFISAWLCDTTAYYVGKYLGKNKLCPKVSPKKTIEGSIGGIIGASVACTIFGTAIFKFGVNIEIIHYILIGLICGIVCQFGDLVASSIKRYAGVKDYSNLIPGHGGILDRFDSILFSSVAVYYYLTFILQL